jgi:Mrp family chromosome partitioning ATPase
VTVNLALAMAQYGKTVAIVDLDLRRPAVDRVLGNYHKLDLITCIAKGLPETWDVSRKLHVLALKTACADNDRILYDPGLKDLLEELRKRVDLVIVDSSSYTTVADTAILLDYVDCSMMVLRQDWTHPEVCRALMKTLKVSKAEYLGYVFNDYRDNKIIYSETGQYSKYRQNETEGSEK